MHSAAAGHAAALVVRGEPGIGKSALLEYAEGRASDYRVLRIRGIAAERDLPYAGLHLLAARMHDDTPDGPAAQRDAFSAAIDVTANPAPDRFAVGMATLKLLTAMAAQRPVCVIVDDAHNLDPASAQVLAFVARRLDRQPLLILLAERNDQRLADLHALPEIHLHPLSATDAHTLLATLAPGLVDAVVSERVLTEARGNPQALIDAFDGITAADFAGGYAIPPPHRSVQCDTTRDGMQRVQQLPSDARRLLLAAAAEPTGDPVVTWRTAARLGIPTECAEMLEAANLLGFGARTYFTHPALRSVTYAAAPSAERREVHRAIAEATDVETDADRRAWHLALATRGLDDALADDLDRFAPMAHARGGIAARAAFLEKSALLTEAPARRAERALAAAAAQHEAGAPDSAHRLLAIAELGPPDPARLARTEWQRAWIDFTSGRGGETPGRLADAGRRLEPHDSTLAREAYLQALVAVMFTRDSADEDTVADIALTGRAALRATPATHPTDLLLDGLAIRALDGYAAAVGPLAKAIATFRYDELDSRTARWLGVAALIAADLWEDGAVADLLSRQRQLATTGDLAMSIDTLGCGALADLQRAGFDAVGARVAQQGRQAAPEGISRTVDVLRAAVSGNSHGRYDEAVDAAFVAAESDQLAVTGWALVELVEAAARSGRRDVATRAAERLAERTEAAQTDWALGVQATSRALLVEGHDAAPLYREAIDRLSRTEARPQLARTQLLFGEWLRRRSRRVDARPLLGAARDLFEEMGAAAFAERAHRELLATGLTSRKRNVETVCQLTPQESRIAYLARDGLSNPEIGARLYVSPRTVEYHLHKVFAKLGITARTELHLVLDLPADAEARAIGSGHSPRRPARALG